MAFRVNAKSFFLTYPQAGLVEHRSIYDYLLNYPLIGDKPEKCLVAKEKHSDGATHYHCFLAYPKKKDLRNQFIFDCFDLHPNIQATRSVKHVLKYVTKEGDFLANFEVHLKLAVKDILSRAKDENEFIDLCLENYNMKFAAGFSNVMKLYHKKNKEKIVCDPLYPMESFKITNIDLLCAISAVTCHQKDGRRTKSIWLSGPSRYGKSGLARSLGQHAYMQNLWNQDCLTDEADYLVLDDLSWESWKFQYKSVLGCQRNVNFTGKYRPLKKMYYNMPCIVITNTLPIFNLEELDWLSVNCTFIEINSRLY